MDLQVAPESVAVVVGAVAQLREDGRLTTKIGSTPVLVVWHDGQPYAIEDRCPHMGFPLRQATVESGLITCHWHHARFDLISGCTLDPWADDAEGFDVSLDGDDVVVTARPDPMPAERLRRRLAQGLEDNQRLVIAKAVLGLYDHEVDPIEIVTVGIDFGVRYRREGWGAGLTVLVAMANLLDDLDDADRPRALIHGLTFVARDTQGHPPRFPLGGMGAAVPSDRTAGWFRRFIDSRSGDAAERSLATELDARRFDTAEAMLFAAVTDHIFIDGGHSLDFTNKAIEAVGLVGIDRADQILPTVVHQIANADRSEERSAWRHPHDLTVLIERFERDLPDLLGKRDQLGGFDDEAVSALAWQLLGDDPEAVMEALRQAIATDASAEQLGRAVAFAAALRIVRFHTQNDHGDWDVVHHSFTAANAVHQALIRHPTPELYRALAHGAMKVYLDRFLNIPAARLPTADEGALDELARCWNRQGAVDEAGNLAAGFLRAGGTRRQLIEVLGRGLLNEDPGFHWYQVIEAGARQSAAWPDGSEEQLLILAGLARFLAAHTPTRRELDRVMTIARRLGRGENLFEEA